MIERWIDANCEKYKINKNGKTIIKNYIETTIAFLITEIEKETEAKKQKRLFIPLKTVYETCEQNLITPDHFSDIGQITDLKEAKKEGKENEEKFPKHPEVA